jgi:hypothetical protein
MPPPARPPAGPDRLSWSIRSERSRAHFSSHITQLFDKTVAVELDEVGMSHADVADMLDDLYSTGVRFKNKCVFCMHWPR